MNLLPVTSTIAAILAIIMLPLTIQITLRRMELGKAMGDIGGVAFGDGNDELLRRRVCAFSNFMEYAPMCLLLLALIEYNGASPMLTWSIGGLLFVGRIIHALSVLYTRNPLPKAIGMFLTYAAFILPALWLIGNNWI
ncbi:MAG: MAPEG family protein [Thiohalomonadales bacterium]